ncbi:MAG: peptidoglycan-binding protein [Micrococcales bacterium]|nr:peptidoglycan-binding protein [Micrococcales bacterium]
MTRARLLAALTIPLTSVPLAAPAHAVIGPPSPSRPLPGALDVAPPYQAQTRCDPTAKPGVKAFGDLMVRHYGTGNYGIGRACTYGVTEHSEGRALDWMLSAYDADQRAVADSVVRWLTAPDSQGRPGAMARRFGIMYIIWNRQMWRAYAPERGWASYSGSSPHTDHIHFSFTWDGAYGRTSWWTGTALTTYATGPGGYVPTLLGSTAPTTTGTPTSGLSAYQTTTLRLWSRGAAVTALQKALGGLTADGVFGPLTEAKVKSLQTASRLPATGVVDSAVWKALIARASSTTSSPAPTVPSASGLSAYQSTTVRLWSRGAAVTALQKALGGLGADGVFGPLTEAKVKAFQTARRLPANGVVDAPVWKALIAAAGGPTAAPTTRMGSAPTTPAPVTTASTRTVYTAYLSAVLRSGSRGEAVKVLQRGLGGLEVDGAFGSRTAAALSAFQRGKGLPGTGVTDSASWRALEARDYPLRSYYGVVARNGSTGAAVSALQRALRVGADGEFGPLTEKAVKAAQSRARLAQTGVVATLTWQAIERQSTGRTY